MEVTDVRLRRVNTDGRMRAIASITLDNEFVVHDIRVIDGIMDCLWQCRANGLLMENSVISLIQSILVHAVKSKKPFLLSIIALVKWKRLS